ncbi:MAG: type 1 glutamine amidotransferase domain-containing protein [Rhodanobacteraceae bacterium]
MSKGTILVIGSSVDTITLKDGSREHAGFYLNEMVVPTQAVLAAGYDMVLATPSGLAPVLDPQSAVSSYFGDSEVALQQALDFVASYPAMQKPRSLRSVVDEGIDRYAAVYVPGGHPPMVDLMQDADLGETLRRFHEAGKLTVLLCHGPVALASAIPKAKEFRASLARGDMENAKTLAAGWPYAGYRMTVFSNDEERWVERTYMDGREVPFFVNDALRIAGGNVEVSGRGIFNSHVVQDRELITGQNPPSDQALAELFVRALQGAESRDSGTSKTLAAADVG